MKFRNLKTQLSKFLDAKERVVGESEFFRNLSSNSGNWVDTVKCGDGTSLLGCQKRTGEPRRSQDLLLVMVDYWPEEEGTISSSDSDQHDKLSAAVFNCT